MDASRIGMRRKLSSTFWVWYMSIQKAFALSRNLKNMTYEGLLAYPKFR
jgi:hypothetical protein